MKRRNVSWTPLAFGAAVVAALSGGSCSSSKAQAVVGLAQGCSLNSDCDDPLICVFGYCHQACTQTRDCPPGEQCVASGNFEVCTLPTETCVDGGACPTGLTCGADKACHDACTTSQDCLVAGQYCSGGSCLDPATDGGTLGSDGGTVEGGGGEGGPDDGGGSDGPKDGPTLPTDAGPLGFASNVPPGTVTSVPASDAGDGGPQTVTVTASCTNCLPVAPVTITQNDGSPADLYVLQSLEVDTTAALALSGPNPIIIAVFGAADIQGTLSVTASFQDGTAGGFSPGGAPGPGSGQSGVGTYDWSGGGGGAYCGAGGVAVASAGTAVAPGGVAYGNATITPLLGGSAGGGGGGFPAGGGAGGGAIQIIAGTSITVGAVGAITAGGGGGSGGNSGGGGSGGAILLEAPTVTIAGTLAANGGGGGPTGANASANAQPASGGLDGDSNVVGGAGSAGATINGSPAVSADKSQGGGGGGAGRIRINTLSGSATLGGTLSPAASTPCVTQGTL
jgi:hypothetical protein